ncbi:GAF domain-containing protein, partial [Paracraurococcus ruber]
DPAPHLAAAAAATARPGQPAALFDALDQAMGGAIGHILFTILVADRSAGFNQRCYTNMPEAYPVGGRKPIVDTPWFRRVLDEGQPYIGRTAEDIREVFFDHDLIRSLGCDSVLNLPVRWNGTSIGTINLLHRDGYYTEADIPTGQQFAALAVPAVLHVIRS